jgi:hypothetical protein
MFKQNAIALTIIQLSPVVLGILAAIIFPSALHNPSEFGKVSAVIFAGGFLLFLTAKILNFKKGIYWSFGSKEMTKYQRWSYKSGYALMLLGLIGIEFLGSIIKQ